MRCLKSLVPNKLITSYSEHAQKEQSNVKNPCVKVKYVKTVEFYHRRRLPPATIMVSTILAAARWLAQLWKTSFANFAAASRADWQPRFLQNCELAELAHYV